MRELGGGEFEPTPILGYCGYCGKETIVGYYYYIDNVRFELPAKSTDPINTHQEGNCENSPNGKHNF